MALIIKHEQLSIASLGWSLAPGLWLESQVPGQLWLEGGGGGGGWEDSGTFPNLLLFNKSFG